ncbi:uncharacterized protein LOC127528315 [Erpetoichthys calabaricus]|uniref:uncharacterized protein LOC127528315 n=1 Tax=Erpetoichthys calabaricus TaxID=27687 RepID=UPI002234E9C6|nr:uncharacterized protein LOC127528315 [Erpetoichthys calabaricus]
MVGRGGQAGQMPNISRLVEAVCIELSRIHLEGTTICGVRVNRWAAVMRDYICIQENVLTNPVLVAQTRIQLFPLNQHTLAQWHYSRTKELVRRALEMTVPLPSSSALASEPTPAVRPRPPSSPLCNSLSSVTHLTEQPRGPMDVAPPIVGHPPVPHEAPATQPLPPPADTAIPPLPPPPAGPSVPRTTDWQRKKKQVADELRRQQGIPPQTKEEGGGLCLPALWPS